MSCTHEHADIHSISRLVKTILIKVHGTCYTLNHAQEKHGKVLTVMKDDQAKVCSTNLPKISFQSQEILPNSICTSSTDIALDLMNTPGPYL